MKYKSFSKFITEKSAQTAAREFDTFANRASRKMARINQKCGQLTGDAKTSCLYGQTDESYIAEQANKLAELQAAYDNTPRGQAVSSGPYAGKMRGELRAMIDALKSGDEQKAKNIEAIGSAGIGGGLQRDQEGNVRVDQATAKRQGDKYMSDVAQSQGGEFNPETGQIEFGAKIPMVSTGNFFSVGKDGNMQTNYGNIAQTVGQTALMAIPGGAAVGALGRGGVAAARAVQGIRGARNIKKAQQIAANARAAKAAGASRTTVQGMQQAGRQTMQQGLRQSAQATRGQAVSQTRAALTGAGNTVRGAFTGARAGTAPLRLGFQGLRQTGRALTSRGAGGAFRGGGAAVGGAFRGTGSAISGIARGGGNVISTAIRNPIKTAALGVGADVAFNDGQISKDLVNRGAEAMGAGPVFSTQADKPKEEPKKETKKETETTTNNQTNTEEKPATDTAATTTAAATTTPAEEPKPDTGAAAATAAAAGTAVADAAKFVPKPIPADATPEERQRIASENLAGSQKARNLRDFGTETPSQAQMDARSAASRQKTADRRASRDQIMADSSSPAMQKAQAEIDRKNKSRKERGLPPLNDTVMNRIKAREANKAVSAAGAAAAAAPSAGSALQRAEAEGRARPGAVADMEAAQRGEVTKNTANPDAIFTPGMVNATNRLFDPNYGIDLPFGMGRVPVGRMAGAVADMSDGTTRQMERMGLGALQTPSAMGIGALYGVDPRALGAGKVDVSGNRRAPVTPANRVDPNAAPTQIANREIASGAADGSTTRTTSAGMATAPAPGTAGTQPEARGGNAPTAFGKLSPDERIKAIEDYMSKNPGASQMDALVALDPTRGTAAQRQADAERIAAAAGNTVRTRNTPVAPGPQTPMQA